MTNPGVTELWVPAERLLPILDAYKGISEHLTARTARKLHLIRTGGQEFVKLYVVDEMLVEMDLVEWLMLPAELGGLADIYFDGKQYGKPQRTHPRKYKTEDERLEARRANWRRREKRRKTEPRVQITCSRCRAIREVGKYYARRLKPHSVCQKCSAAEVGSIWIEHARNQIRKAA